MILRAWYLTATVADTVTVAAVRLLAAIGRARTGGTR